MAFWSDAALEPKRQFKFKVAFAGTAPGSPFSEQNFPTYIAQSADRPQYTITDATKVDYLDKQFHFPGKISWNQVKIKFVDAYANGADSGNLVNSTKASYDYLTQAGWITPVNAGPAQGVAQMKTISKQQAAGTVGAVKVYVLKSDGSYADEWTLRNAWITNVALNNLDYAAEAVLTVEYTFRYDWADFQPGL